jgi:hypothetical protein
MKRSRDSEESSITEWYSNNLIKKQLDQDTIHRQNTMLEMPLRTTESVHISATGYYSNHFNDIQLNQNIVE